MLRHIKGRIARFARRAAAVVACAALALEGAPALAQRRQAEPEANPDFQNTTQPKTGEPVGGGENVTEPSTAGAASAAPASDSGGDEKLIESRSVQSVQIGAAPTAKAEALPASAPLDTRVTVRVKGAPLATFLDTISAQAKVNFIITEGLEQKRVTAFLQNVTVREALQVLLEIKGLTYQEIGKSSTYVVTQRSKQAINLITRIYPLSFIPLIPLSTEDSGDSETKAGAQAGTVSTTAGGGGGSKKPCSTKNQKISVSRIICSVLSSNGDIEIEPRTNQLIVTDIPEVFPQVEEIIHELDRKAPQVMIEAQIVEIDSTRTRNLGFEWGGPTGELASFTGGQRDTSFPLNLPQNLGNTHFFDPLNPSGGIISSLQNSGSSTAGNTTAGGTPVISQGGYLKTSVLDLSQLQITLRALVERSEGRFLGKPKIMTLNNKTATIQISANEAVALITNQSSAGGALAQQSVTPERYDTGVILKVTPQINKEGYITMLLQPSYTDVQAAAVSTASNPIFNPVKRQAVTMVRVKNGQTLVMGGLLSSIETKDVRKVPFLGYIPLIGWLFTSDSNTRTNTDLVIFITPTIVSD
ncbi:MAG: secretin N-terminal domain-containing protein [Elusimicrobiota bacterium]